MDSVELYDRDFVGWTERQANLLRELAPGTHGLDTAQLAEEIEDLGRSEMRETSSLLLQVLLHLLKLAADPQARSARHWIEEVVVFQAKAAIAFTPGMRQRIDLDDVWRLAGNGAAKALAPYGVALGKLPAECPLTLDQLLDREFDPLDAAATIAASIGAV